MREDNLLRLREKPFVPYTTNSRREFPIVANLTRGRVPTGLDQIWVADISLRRIICTTNAIEFLNAKLDTSKPPSTVFSFGTIGPEGVVRR